MKPTDVRRMAMVVATGLVCAVSACNLEVNINLDSADEAAPTPRREYRTPPRVDDAIGDALWRPEEWLESPGNPGYARDVCAESALSQYTTAPLLLNRSEIVRIMAEAYPPGLRDAGVGGTVHVLLCIETDGLVSKTQIDRSSRIPQLDAAALEVAGQFVFDPAESAGVDIAAWISFPITFRVR